MQLTKPNYYFSDNAGSPVQKIKDYLDALNKVAPKNEPKPYPYRETSNGLEIPGQSYFVLDHRVKVKEKHKEVDFETVFKIIQDKIIKRGEFTVLLSNVTRAEEKALGNLGVVLSKNLYGIASLYHLTKPPDPPPPPVGQSINLYHLVLPTCLHHRPLPEPINCKELVIAILDTGIDTFYFNQKFSNYFSGLTSLEEDANGDEKFYQYLYNDGCNIGYNTIGPNLYVNYHPDYLDDHGHGTAIAKIIKNIMRAEKAKACYRLLPIKVMDHNLMTNTCAVLEGMHLARKHHAKLINCSFGFPYQVPDIEYFIEENPDMFFVASMGNSEKNVDHIQPGFEGNFPSNYASKNSNVFEVMALSAYQHYHLYRDYHTPAPFANYSLKRTVYGAPGREVPGMYPSYALGSIVSDSYPSPAAKFKNYSPYPDFAANRPVYGFTEGSSMSAAYITGVLATYLAAESHLEFKNLRAEAMHSRLRDPDHFILHTMDFDHHGQVKYYYNPQVNLEYGK